MAGLKEKLGGEAAGLLYAHMVPGSRNPNPDPNPKPEPNLNPIPNPDPYPIPTPTPTPTPNQVPDSALLYVIFSNPKGAAAAARVKGVGQASVLEGEEEARHWRERAKTQAAQAGA